MVWGALHLRWIDLVVVSAYLLENSCRNHVGYLLSCLPLHSNVCGWAYIYLEVTLEFHGLFEELNISWAPLTVSNCLGLFSNIPSYQKRHVPTTAVNSSNGLTSPNEECPRFAANRSYLDLLQLLTAPRDSIVLK